MTAAFTAFITNPDSEKIYLVELEAAKIIDAAVETITLYLDTTGMIFNNNYYTPAVKGVPRLSRKMQDVFFGTSFPAWGELELNHAAGYYLDPDLSVTFDDLISDWTLAGRAVVVKIGGRSLAYSDYETIFTGKQGFHRWGQKTLTIPVFDGQADLSEVKLPQNTFAAGGDMPAYSVGKLIPVCLGYVKNVTPVKVHTNNKVYQVHDTAIGGAINDVATAYDDGASVAFTKQLANGQFTLNAVPGGRVTCDVEGAKFSAVFEETIGGLIEALLTEVAGLGGGDIDSTMMTAFKTAIPYEVGLYITSQTSILDILDRLTGGIPCWYGFSRAGVFQIAEFTEPSGSSDADLTNKEIMDGTLEGERDENLWYLIRVGYNLDYGSDEYQIEDLEDTDLPDLCPHAKEADLFTTCLRDAADAAAVATKWQDLSGEQRSIYRLTAKSVLLQYFLGDQISVTWPRFNLDETLFRIIGIEEDYTAKRVTVDLWG